MNPTTMSGPSFLPGLDAVQGNILKGHGRKYTALVFFRFARRSDAADDNRRLLRDAANAAREEIAITTAAKQQGHSEDHRKNVAVEHPFRSLGLSADGLAACGYTAKTLGIAGPLGSDPFWAGAADNLFEDTAAWHPAFGMKPDGVFLLAHAEAGQRDGMATDTEAALRAHYGVADVEVEKGFRWTPLEKQGDSTTYEHFGFADGFARTKIVAETKSLLKHLVDATMGFVKRTARPFELPLRQVLIDESGPFCGASFLVVHKLEQNVRGFLEAEAFLEGRRADLPSGILRENDRAGSLFIGRTADGTPLAPGATRRTDRFHFGGDREGSRCPFSAHIRKMNPRQNKLHNRPHVHAGRKDQKAAQFVRRGVLYGDETQVSLTWSKPADAPDRDVGMLFMGYMSRIGAQFLAMWLNWGPSEGFPQAASGRDPLLGGAGADWQWPAHPDFVTPGTLRLGHFVKSKGAVFLVVPSVSWLKTV